MSTYSIILVEPKYEGNIGSVARVMKNFGFSDLILVNPQVKKIGKEARKMATHAQDILKNAKIISKFSEVTEKFDFLVGTTAIVGTDRNPLRTPITAEKLKNSLKVKGKIALVFGREDYGLFNEEIQECDLLVTIPANEEFPTLSLPQSVGILLYELSKLKFLSKKRNEMKKFMEANLLEKKILLEKFSSLVDSVYPKNEHDFKKKIAKKTFKTLIGRAFISGREAFTLTGIFRRAKEKMGR